MAGLILLIEIQWKKNWAWWKIGRKFRTKNNVNDHAALVDYKN